MEDERYYGEPEPYYDQYETGYEATEIATPLSSWAWPAEAVDEGVAYYDEYEPLYHPGADPVQWRMTAILAVVVFLTVLFGLFRLNGRLQGNPLNMRLLSNDVVAAAPAAFPAAESSALNGGVVAPPGTGIAPFFTPEVQYWEGKIVEWAAEHNLDPNMVATVMQIESCGHSGISSSAGAQGLFQVMPFHFTRGEIMTDPNTNARRGMAFLVEMLELTDGDVGLAFAGYNGGHRAARGSWNTWVNETQRYYVWSTGIYEEALQGKTTSDTLREWLGAGGASLCSKAAAHLGL